jgi:geranylgeranyl pyrophosphate synthase
VSATGTAPFDEVLAAGGERVGSLMQDVERQLGEVTSAWGSELERSAGSTLAAGGKRLRPLLVFICGLEAGGGRAEREALVRAGAAVELIHMATLVHDDVLDSAPLRRGSPTVYASAGRDAATATGDFLFSRAFALLGQSSDPGQVRVLSDACLALARGELVQRQDAYARRLSVERYLHRCELKTASLFSAACRLGSLASGRVDLETETLARFGRRIGLAFQLLDDLLDVAGSSRETGKRRGTDLLDGTVTLPLILAAETDRELADLDLRDVSVPEDAERICDRIAATGAPVETRRRATQLVSTAKGELDGALDPKTVGLLNLVADRIVDRAS